MSDIVTPEFYVPRGGRIGFVDEGQLGRMMAQEALTYGFEVGCLGPKGPSSPTGLIDGVTAHVGATNEPADLRRLAEWVGRDGVISLDSEHGVSVDGLQALVDDGYTVFPEPSALRISQDKWWQKKYLDRIGAPYAPSRMLDDEAGFFAARKYLGVDFIAKARTGAYDGRGNRSTGVDMTWDKLTASFVNPTTGSWPELYAEQRVAFDRELSLVGARSHDGDIQFFPLVETRQTNGICDVTLTPVDVDAHVIMEAKRIARRVIRGLGTIGVVAVEMFEVDGEVLVNEFALRVHNSGHWTDCGTKTSQFLQHVRAITGRSLGSREVLAPAVVMKNILGFGLGSEVPDLSELQFPPNVHVRTYDKTPAANRKMGHITVTGQTTKRALEQAEEAHALIRPQLGEPA